MLIGLDNLFFWIFNYKSMSRYFFYGNGKLPQIDLSRRVLKLGIKVEYNNL